MDVFEILFRPSFVTATVIAILVASCSVAERKSDYLRLYYLGYGSNGVSNFDDYADATLQEKSTMEAMQFLEAEGFDCSPLTCKKFSSFTPRLVGEAFGIDRSSGLSDQRLTGILFEIQLVESTSLRSVDISGTETLIKENQNG